MATQGYHDKVFLKIAKDLSAESHCVSQKVGCVFVRRNRIIMSGINGTAEGEDNCDSLFPAIDFDPAQHRAWADEHEIHAEMNALISANVEGVSLVGATLYCNLQPCYHCVKNLIPLRISRIVYGTPYGRVENTEAVKQRLANKGIIYDFIPYDD